MNKYNDINSCERDCMIEFDEENHIYTYKGKQLNCVTSFIESFFTQFDSNYWAKIKARKEGVSPQEMLDRWAKIGEQASKLGTEMHAKIENFYLGNENKSDPAYDLFLDFENKYHLNPYRTEWRIFYEEYGIAGTLDCLDCQNGEYVLYDWKRSNRLIKDGKEEHESPYHKFAFEPISHISDSSYYKYALQTSMYRYILEKKYNIKVSRACLGVFHPDNEKFYTVDVPYLRDEIIAMLNNGINE